jgi:polysaccharide pyruvyl transferase CsaB
MRVVVCGYYGMGNGGDEALLASVLQMLPSTVTPIVLSGNPKQTRERYGVESRDRWSALQVIQALRQSDALIWGGGSLMQDTTSRLSPWYYGGMMRLAQVMGLKTIAWAQGIGPLTRPTTIGLAKQVFQHCTQVTVRDAGSAALLTDWGIPFNLAPDPVWALASTATQGPIDLEDLPAPRVAVNLRSHPDLTPARLECLTQALIDFQKIAQVSLLLLPFQASRDLAIAAAIQPRLPGHSKVLMIEHPQALKGVFRHVDLTIAMRLHGLIMAAAEGCRCFALSYDPKVSQLMASLDLPGWQLIEIPINSRQICQTWLESYANAAPLSVEQMQTLVDRALIHQTILQTTLADVNQR